MTSIRIAIASAFALGTLLAGGVHAQHTAPVVVNHVAALTAAKPEMSPVLCCD